MSNGGRKYYSLRNNMVIDFPLLRRDDPISKFYGYNRGDVIKITRPNNYISYSIVKG